MGSQRNNLHEWNMFRQAMRITKGNMQSSSKKSCKNKEFDIEEGYDYGINYTNSFSLSVRFKDPKKVPSHQNVWTSQVVKTVSREFYIDNLFGLFGTVGGTLGIFV